MKKIYLKNHIGKMLVKLIDKKYSWSDMSLQTFINEGNTPYSWNDFFHSNTTALNCISEKLEKEKQRNSNLIVYPPIYQVFRAFIPVQKIKVVVLGQDPYHSGTNEYDGSAVGYCFSVLEGNKINPSLGNIYKELKRDGFKVEENGELNHWATQGCFMLNTALTVEKGCADSHTSIWYDFTENVVKYIAENCESIVWLLMGSKAHVFKKFIPETHKVLCTSHPSPFSCMRETNNIPAFIGSGLFRKTNEYLVKNGKCEIRW